LDQAEEYFLYHADDAGPGSFAETLPALLAGALRVNVLVSLREDSLAKLDRFTGRIPGLFSNTLRLDRLDRESARAAIVRPVDRFAELTGRAVSIEPTLVEQVLDEVGAGQIEPALGGLGAVEGPSDGSRIEAPYLQLVMQRLWDEEQSRGSDVLQLETLDRLGRAQHIVEEHLDGALAALTSEQKDVAGRLFNHLVTPSGTKIGHEVADLADFGRVPLDELRPVLDTLTERRILRSLEEGGDVRYEIFHDVLAEPVLAWRASHEADRELERQREESDRRHRRLLAVIGVGAILLAAMAAVTVFALTQRAEAREQASEATAHQLEALAAGQLERDPELALLLALEAARLAPSESSEKSLRDALLASRVRAVVPVGEQLVGAASRGEEVLGVTADGDVVSAAAATGSVSGAIETAQPVEDASFADDGTVLLTGRDGALRVVGPTGEIDAVAGVSGARAAAISPDGTLAAIVADREVRLVELASGSVLRTYPHPAAISAAISSDNRRVVTGGEDDRVYVWSGQSGRRIQTLSEHQGNAAALAFSPDGTLVASASADGLGRIWRAGTWGLSAVLAAPTALTDISFSTDGEHVVTASRDGTARVWKADTGAPLITLPGHGNWVTSAAFSGPVGSPVVTASLDGRLRVWDALFQPELEELAALPEAVTMVDVPDPATIRVVAGDGRRFVLDASTGARLDVERGVRRPRRSFGPDGARATIHGRTVVLEADGETVVLEGHRDRVTAVTFSPDGSRLATASIDHDVRIWDVASATTLHTLLHNTAVHDVRFSPDGRWLVAAANRAVLWNARDGTDVVRLQGHEGTVTAVAFDPSGRTIVSGGADGTVRTYECEVCVGIDGLVELAERRLESTGRTLTPDERARFLG
ncbi:MAG TPA: WD40 repeat domain-containing protein, partial [Gaiellaceae bacterium]|nr:WD40 repeat domain-containing protein [Gaiellaceae bacterium]